MKIIISGGGTGGHVFPAIAIADAIRELEPRADILFVGAKGRLEMEKVPQAGYRIEGLWISGFQRSLTWKNLLFPVKLIHSWWKARQIVRRFRPDVAVGVGGYASGPLLNAAGSLGIPTLLQEQNSYPGVTNRILARKADRICVAYEGLEQFFPAEKILLTGNPVRSGLLAGLEGKRQEALAYFGLKPGKATLFLFGGSLGARSLNEAMRGGEELLRSHPEIQVLWQCGRSNHEQFSQCGTAGLPTVRLLPFIDRMDLAYAAADLVVSRAGALSVSELCMVGKPAILVPSPHVAEDHQTKNAMALVNRNAALLVRDTEAGEKLLPAAVAAMGNTGALSSLAANLASLAKPDAAVEIARAILALARRGGKN